MENISISTFGNPDSINNLPLKRFGLIKENKSSLLKPSQHHLFVCLGKTFAKTRFDYLKDLQLADPGFTDKIDLLIGSDLYWSIVTGKKNWQEQRNYGCGK